MVDYDVIIVGAGSMGMAAGYFLAKEGKEVLMIDAFDPPHEWTSHEGDTRFISPASGEGGPYVPLTIRALEIWKELQAKSTEQIFINNGALTFGLPNSKFVQTAIESAEKFNLDVEYFKNGKELKKRWPDLQFPDEIHGILEPNGGTLSTTNAIRTFRLFALQEGAELLTNNPVLDLEVTDDMVSVEAQDGTYTAEKLILSAGPYMNKFLSKLDLDLNLEPARRVIGWFDADDQYYATDVFPSFYGDTSIGVYYGFPALKDYGFKIGKFYEPDEVQPDADNLEPEYINQEFGAYRRDERELRKFLSAYMPKANGHLIRGAVGMFTNTSDEDYVIDFHPKHDNVIIAAGFSGNGFKVSSAVGEILSQLAAKGESNLDISAFSATRDALNYRFSEQEESLTFGKLKNI